MADTVGALGERGESSRGVQRSPASCTRLRPSGRTLIRPLRRLHRGAILTLVLFVVPIVVLAVVNRLEVPVKVESLSRASPLVLVDPGPWAPFESSVVSGLRVRLGSDGTLAEIEASESLAVPDVLLYLGKGSTSDSDLPPGSILVGELSWPGSTVIEVGSDSTVLFLYSLGHGRVVHLIDLGEVFP